MINGFSVTLMSLGITGTVYMIIINLLSILNYSNDIGETNWSWMLSLIELGIAGCILLLTIVSGAIYVHEHDIKNKTAIRWKAWLYGILCAASLVVSAYRMSEMGIIFPNGLCKRTKGDLVCQTVLFKTYRTIEEIGDCNFNAFAESSSAWKTTGSYLIDWSNKDVYTDRNLLYAAYKNATGESGNIVNEDEMLIYSDCYYWGCDPICNDRHDHNMFLAYSSTGASGLYLVMIIISVLQIEVKYTVVLAEPEADPEADPEAEPEADQTGFPQLNLDPEEPAPDLEDPAPDLEDPEEDQTAPDAVEPEDKSDSFSGSKSLKLRFLI